MQDVPITHRSTPHPAKGVHLMKSVQGRFVGTKLDYINEPKQHKEGYHHQPQRCRVQGKKKQQREARKTKENNLLLGDYKLVKLPKNNKWSTPYEPMFSDVCSILGSQTASHVRNRLTVLPRCPQIQASKYSDQDKGRTRNESESTTTTVSSGPWNSSIGAPPSVSPDNTTAKSKTPQ